MLTHNAEFKQIFMDGKPMALTKLQYKVLSILVDNAGQTLSQYDILDRVYGGKAEVDSRVVKVTICNLRKRVAGISTIWGKGYRFDQ